MTYYVVLVQKLVFQQFSLLGGMTEQGRFRTLRIPQFVTQRDAVKYSLPLYFDNTNVSKTIKNFYKNPTAHTLQYFAVIDLLMFQNGFLSTLNQCC